MKNSGILLLILGITTFIACQNNNTEETTRQLVGRWELEQALRNNAPTESISDLYMEFSADGKLKTNAAGMPEEGTYEIEKNKILQRNTSINADYKIEEMDDAKLVLTTELVAANKVAYEFRFLFKKVAPGDTEEETTQQMQ